MARHLPSKDLTIDSPKSPAGFWPNPDKELFYKIQTPPWEVPKKRKTRGRTQEFYYDLTNDNIIWKQCGEIATFNKFDLIDPEETRLKSTDPEDIYTSDKKTNDITFTDFHEYNDFFAGDSVINESFHDFMGTRNKYMSSNKHFMYSNKNNFCSGYFPDFITLDNS